MFLIDGDKCKGDSICVTECPMGIIRLNRESKIPEPVDYFAQACINCGHCVAVCPQGAFSLKTMSAQECKTLAGSPGISPAQAELFLTSRRSVRVYKKQPVAREDLARLIKIAGYAPSGHNHQPVSWLIIEDSNEVKKLSGLVADWMKYMVKEAPQIAMHLNMDKVVAAWDLGVDKICRGAPHIVVAHAPEALVTAPAACTIALTYLELAAYSMDLGACWAGYLGVAAATYPPLIEALGLPQGHKCYGAMMVGHPKYKYHRIPLRKNPDIIWR